MGGKWEDTTYRTGLRDKSNELGTGLNRARVFQFNRNRSFFLKKLVSFDHKSGRQLRKSRCGRPAEVFLFPVSLDRRLLARKVELSNDPGKTVRALGLSGIFFL